MSSFLRKVALYLLGPDGVHDLVRAGEATITARMHARGIIATVFGDQEVGAMARVSELIKRENNHVKRRAAVRAMVREYTTNTHEVDSVVALLLMFHDVGAFPVSEEQVKQRGEVKRLHFGVRDLELDELLRWAVSTSPSRN